MATAGEQIVRRPAPARIRVLLVVGGMPGTAITATLTARIREGKPTSSWRFVGPVRVAPAVAEHLETVVLQFVERIVARLGRSRQALEFAVETPGMVAASGSTVTIDGYSLDVAVAAAALAALLDAPLRSDVACTGHIASPDGRIAFVCHIPEKLQAAERDSEIRTVVLPEADDSVGMLLPAEQKRVAGAIAAARGKLRIIITARFSGVLPEVFSETDLVLAGLRCGFFDVTPPAADELGDVSAAVRVLLGATESRFWSVLEQSLHRGDAAGVERLLSARLEFAASRATYPSGFGDSLQRYIAALPPALRRLKLPAPLVGYSVCSRAAQFAGVADQDDAALLLHVAAGCDPLAPAVSGFAGASAADTPGDNALLRLLVAELNNTALTERIDGPIDRARAGFPLTATSINSPQAVHECIIAFTVHLLNHAGGLVGSVDHDAVGGVAMGLLEAAYGGAGGYNVALAESLHPSRGGLIAVLDALTQQFKRQHRQDHFRLVLSKALQDSDALQRTEFFRALLVWVRPYLPAEARYDDPAAFAEHWQELVPAIMAGLDRVDELLRKY